MQLKIGAFVVQQLFIVVICLTKEFHESHIFKLSTAEEVPKVRGCRAPQKIIFKIISFVNELILQSLNLFGFEKIPRFFIEDWVFAINRRN